MIRRGAMWLIPAGVLAADRITKTLAVNIPPEGAVLIPGVVGLRYTRNTGAAFSILSGHPWLLGIAGLAAVCAAVLMLRKKNLSPLMRTGLMMMLGGAAGNMADRLLTGYVPDMIEILFVDFAIFNVADIFLCLGCALAVMAVFRKDASGKEETASGETV